MTSYKEVSLLCAIDDFNFAMMPLTPSLSLFQIYFTIKFSFLSFTQLSVVSKLADGWIDVGSTGTN